MGHSHLVWLVLRVPSLHALVFIQKTFCDLYIYVTDCNRVEVTLLASLFEYEVCISRCMSSQVALVGTNHGHEG